MVWFSMKIFHSSHDKEKFDWMNIKKKVQQPQDFSVLLPFILFMQEEKEKFSCGKLYVICDKPVFC